MPEIIDWRQWINGYRKEDFHPFLERALAAFMEDERVAALWISGSRATDSADEHSDTDIRIHAPQWSESDLAAWLERVDGSRRAQVRLSKLGPAALNYECMFTNGVCIDLLVLTGNAPVIAFESVVLKCREPLERQTASQLVREVALTPAEVRYLMSGLVIDLRKFPKLFARRERLAALLLLNLQRFAILRLAYIASRGMDCGGMAQHTLASLKHLRRVILEASLPIPVLMENVTWEGPVEAAVEKLQEIVEPLFATLRTRFPQA